MGLHLDATSIGIDIHEGGSDIRLANLAIEHALINSSHTTHNRVSNMAMAVIPPPPYHGIKQIGLGPLKTSHNT